MDQLDITSTTSRVAPLGWVGFTFVTAHHWRFAKVWVAVAGLCSLPATRAQISRANSISCWALSWSCPPGGGMGSELFGLGIEKGGTEQEGVCVFEFSRSIKLCSGLFNQEGPPCDLWAVCSTLVLWMGDLWWSGGAGLRVPLVWSGLEGTVSDPALCSAQPGSLTPQSLCHSLPHSCFLIPE